MRRNPDWYLPLSETGGDIAFAFAGPDGTYRNDPQLGVASIAKHDIFGKSVGLSGVTQDTPHITAESPLNGSDITIDMIVQLDDLTRPKHVLLTTLGTGLSGQFSIEVLQGGQTRAWSREQGTVREIVGSVGDVPQGSAVKITYQRQSGAAPSQRLLVNGVVKAQDPTPRAWDPVPAGTVYIGTWVDPGTGDFLAPTDGLIAHVVGWNRYLATDVIAQLVQVQSVVWAEDIDAGALQQGTSKEISVLESGWHGKAPIAVTAGNGSLVTTTEDGDRITIQAGDAIGEDNTFLYGFTDASGRTSPTRTVTIDVVNGGAEGVVLPAPLTAFGHTRVRVTTLAGWPAGRTPKEVASQGSLAHAYVRRSSKPTQNDGTWIDFQAGWKNGTGDSVAVKLDDGSLLNISCDVTNAIPTPGLGGTTRTLDKLGGGNFTDWNTAIGALQNNDVLVVRARAGGEVYAQDNNSGGPSSTRTGVKVVAHPDDIAAGRRPRVHVRGTELAKFMDDLNNGHWEVDPGSPAASHVYRTTASNYADPGNIGCSYRTAGGTWKKCWTYTNTASGLALRRLRDTTYPRISASAGPSTWNLYMGPGIYWEGGRYYIRLDPLTNVIGAKQTNAGSRGPNPPWDWNQYFPASTNPNNVQLIISSTVANGAEKGQTTTTNSYCLRVHGPAANWTIENIDFVGGGDTLQLGSSTTTAHGGTFTMRGCRILGWAFRWLQDNLSSTIHDVHDMLEAEFCTVRAERCEFWGATCPWHSFEEVKVRWGAYGGSQYSNVFWTGSGPNGIDIKFTNCLFDGFSAATRNGGDPHHIRFHNCKMQGHWGSDGAIITSPVTGDIEYIRCHIEASTLLGYAGADAAVGNFYVGYCFWNNVRPAYHRTGYWDSAYTNVNQWVPLCVSIPHGADKVNKLQFMYQNTAVGSHDHMTHNNNAIGPAGAGCGLFIAGTGKLGGTTGAKFYTRNNIGVVIPSPSLGITQQGASRDAHVMAFIHGNTASPVMDISHDYDHFYRYPGMAAQQGSNVFATCLSSSGVESTQSNLAGVRSATGHETNGTEGDPLFAVTPSYNVADSVLYDKSRWLLAAGSPARTGGNSNLSSQGWKDNDFGTVITYAGHAWRGCFEPDVPALEQQVGPLGPLPSHNS